MYHQELGDFPLIIAGMRTSMRDYRKFWNRIASSYAATPIKDKDAFKQLIGTIKTYLNSDDVVLDYGCGTGTYAIAIADSVRSVHAIDIAENMLAIAGERTHGKSITNISYENCDLFDKGLQPASYNVVLAFHILHLQSDVSAALARIHELLMPNGLLICRTVCFSETFSLFTNLLWPLNRLGWLPYLNVFSYEKLQRMLTENQFNLLDTTIDKEDSREYFIVAQK